MINMAKNLTGMNWLKKQIGKLEVSTSNHSETIDEIKTMSPKVYNEFQAWTPLKLILLNYSLTTCSTIITSIIKNRSYIFDKMYYVDLFAGSGFNKIKGPNNDFFVGSPFIALLNHLEKFDGLFFCEANKKFNDALQKRLDYFKNTKINLSNGDYKDSLDDILKIVSQNKSYSFFFIDPYSMEFDWGSMEKILNVRSDIIFNFMTGNIIRDVCAGKGRRNNKVLDGFFGSNTWKKINTDDELIEFYIQKIKSKRKNAVVRTIKVHSKKHGFRYHLFFITTETKGGTSWIRAIEKAKSEIESQSDIAVELALDIVKKRQRDLSSFL